jgi:hypothetical protein
MKTDCCCPSKHPAACGCCEGIEILTPLATVNRPGLPALSYRIGTHAAFLETMKARLSSSDFPALATLTSREADDPAMALLDAWATVGDVLTFYQERIANEGYLRTATERRSVLELARLVGYRPRPGVASSVYVAYIIENTFKEETTIPKGARSQSVPGPGELPQSFETSEELKARAKWNNLKPRMTQPQRADSIDLDRENESGQRTYKPRVYLKGISTNLKPNDPLLIGFGSDTPEFYRVKEVKPDPVADGTLVTLQDAGAKQDIKEKQINLIHDLTFPPSVQKANSLRLERNLKTLFLGSGIDRELPGSSLVGGATRVHQSVSLRKTLAGGEASHSALKAFAPVLRETLATAVENAQVTEQNRIKVYALRLKASLFGHNAPREPEYETVMSGGGELETPIGIRPKKQPWLEWDIAPDEDDRVLYLDRRYNEILPGSYVAVEKLNDEPKVFGDIEVQYLSRNAYGISAETTKITLISEWWSPDGKIDEELRTTSVYAQSEELELAEEPIEEIVCGGTDELLELDGLYEGLESGRWVIVTGERDIPGTSGVRFSELAMLASVTHNVGAQVKVLQSTGNPSGTTTTTNQALAGDRTRTFIQLAAKLAYCFKRDTVTIYGNVVKATHGEMRKEVLGSGDGSKGLQSFALKQPPLTYVSASNPSGVDSTLKIYVDEVQWREADFLPGLSPTDRTFIMKTDDDSKTTVVFGNGREGARLPTGIENIKAEYRNGIGKMGNVKAGQVTLLSTRPLGVKEVINPLRASGGADKESRDQMRKHVPLAVKALDRLVSVQDYEDFTRIYAGIGKARAVELSDGRRQLVHITIAGADDIPIDENSDLYRNLRQSLLDLGDPYQAIQLEIRELMLIVITARLRILPEYQWEQVVTQVRTALLEAFSFERRELGQDVLLSEVMSVMQAVRGVVYVDVDLLRGIPEKIPDTGNPGKRRLLTPEEIAKQVTEPLTAKDQSGSTVKEPLARVSVNLADSKAGTVFPAQLAFLTPDVPETLILNQIT